MPVCMEVITILNVGCFSLPDHYDGDLCHLIMYSGIAGFAYLGLGIIDPISGDFTSPYQFSRFGLPPKTGGAGRNNECYHENIRGNITAGGISFSYGGSEYYQSSYDGSTAIGRSEPGLICWEDAHGNMRSLPTIRAWSDGQSAYGTWMPEYPFLYQPDTLYNVFNWRKEHAYDVRMSGNIRSYEWTVTWDPNFAVRPVQHESGFFQWIPELRVYRSYQTTVIYALPASYFTPHTVSLTARAAFEWLYPHLNRMPTLPFEGVGPVRKALEGFNALDMNNVENSSSFSAKDILPLKALRELRKNPVKGIADLYLWYKYSFVPNVSDFIQIWKNVDRLFQTIDQQKKSYGTVVARGSYLDRSLTTKYNAYVVGSLNCATEMQKVSQRLSTLGLDINLQNVWDLIPFSFVVDWFVPISDALGEMDYEISAMLNKWNISCVEQSTRTSWECPAEVFFTGCTGSIELVRYSRTYSSTLPPDQINFGSKDPSKHVCDGAALIISNW